MISTAPAVTVAVVELSMYIYGAKINKNSTIWLVSFIDKATISLSQLVIQKGLIWNFHHPCCHRAIKRVFGCTTRLWSQQSNGVDVSSERFAHNTMCRRDKAPLAFWVWELRIVEQCLELFSHAKISLITYQIFFVPFTFSWLKAVIYVLDHNLCHWKYFGSECKRTAKLFGSFILIATLEYHYIFGIILERKISLCLHTLGRICL